MAEPRIVFITSGSQDEAQRIARALVEERLAACANILPGILSIYRWQGQVHQDQEVLLIAKTTARKVPPLIRRVKQLHSYEVPEIIALPIVAGSEEYLDWIDGQTPPEP